MKVLQVIDFGGWAIGALARTIQQKNLHIDIDILEIHPKDLRRDTENWSNIFDQKVKEFNPDIIHFHYWDLANTLAGKEACKGRKIILTHHNQKNLLTYNWENIDCLVTHTQRAKNILKEAGHWNIEVIQHGIDIEHFKYNEKYKADGNIGYVGRIVDWKGLVDIAKYAKEAGKKVTCMGRIDKADYWKKCQEYKEQLDIRFGTADEDQISVYHEMNCYIGNSRDGIEEGTLGLLEAMACGVPVITTRSGEANDIIKDGENGILVEFENYKSLRDGINRFLKMSLEEKNKMRQAAWNTVKNMNKEIMARNYEKLYYNLAFEKDLVSVIIPTFNRAKTIANVLDAYGKQQTYKPVELIVCDDNSSDETFKVIDGWKKKNKSVSLKYINTMYSGYGLAGARNHGIFEASGNYLLFSDDRFIPEPEAVEVFVNHIKKIKSPSAVWGNKGAGKRDFIENFFMIRKQHIANCGMFNERINEYGGQSQEIRERMRNLNYILHFETAAKSEAQFGTKNKSKKRYEILRMKTKLWKLRN